MGLVETFLQVMNTVITVLLWTWWLIIIGTLFGLKKKWGKFPIEAIILEKRKNNLVKTNDRIGIHYDKLAEFHEYKFQKSGETIPVMDFDIILHNNLKDTNFLERLVNFLRPTVGAVFLLRYGSKQYKPINVTDAGGKLQLTAVKDNNGEDVYIYSYNIFDPRDIIKVIDFEVVDWDNINFMIQEQRATDVRRRKKGEFWKQLAVPAMMIGGAILVAIFILKFSTDAAVEFSGRTAPAEEGGSVIGGAISDAITPGA